MTRLAKLSLVVFSSIVFVSAQAPQNVNSGTLRQIIPGYYVYSVMNGGRPFNSGIIATNEGALVIDALGSDAVARAERESRGSTKYTGPATNYLQDSLRFALCDSIGVHRPGGQREGFRLVAKSGHRTQSYYHHPKSRSSI